MEALGHYTTMSRQFILAKNVFPFSPQWISFCVSTFFVGGLSFCKPCGWVFGTLEIIKGNKHAKLMENSQDCQSYTLPLALMKCQFWKR